MQDFEIEWEMKALEDRAHHYKYLYDNATPLTADTVDEKIQEAANNLTLFPNIGKPADKGRKGRTYHVPKTRYLIYYVVNENSNKVLVLRVFHSRQQHP